MKIKKLKKGFSLVEVLLGLSVLAVTGVGLAQVSTMNMRASYKNLYDTLVTFYAKSVFEQITSMPLSSLAGYINATSIPVYGATPNPYVPVMLPLFATQSLATTPFSILVDKERNVSFPVSFLVSLSMDPDTAYGVTYYVLRVSLTYEYMNTFSRQRVVGSTFFATIPVPMA